VITTGAQYALDEAKQRPQEFLMKHALGDWGVVSTFDKQENNKSINGGTRILSAYLLNDNTKIWIITEADRSSTCILLPSEY